MCVVLDICSWEMLCCARYLFLGDVCVVIGCGVGVERLSGQYINVDIV